MIETNDPKPTKIQGLQDRILEIHYDFDRHRGVFSGIDYYSPLDQVEDLCQFIGCPDIERLKLATTLYRERVCSKTLVPDDLFEVFETFKESVELALKEGRIQNSPPMRGSLPSNPAVRKQAEKIFTEEFENLPVHNMMYGSDRDYFDITAKFTDAFDHNVNIHARITYKYSGRMRFHFSFPYYNHETEPTQITSSWLLGDSLFFDINAGELLGRPPNSGLYWYADFDSGTGPRVRAFNKTIGSIVSILTRPVGQNS